MPEGNHDYPDPDEDDIMAGDRRISRPDSRLPDWYISDAAYRPIPIVWFAAAVIAQSVALFVIAIVFADKNGWFTIGLSTLMTMGIFHWAWQRGIKGAGMGWRVATPVVLTLQLLLIIFSALGRI
jgi:hypothetical protein